MAQIIPTAEPFFFPGKGENARIGCLVQHGFTGTPKEVRWMGEYLNRQGYTVCGMRLTGHATKTEDMIRSRFDDWLASMEDGYNLLHSSCEQVFFLGLSLGAVLSLVSATRMNVRGVVAMSPIYKLPAHPLLKYYKIVSVVRPTLPKGKGKPGSGWFDKESWKQHVSYPENPVNSIGELNKLLGIMRASLPNVRVPVLLVSSRDDHYYVDGGMDSIYNALGSTDKQKIWVEGSGHVITEEPKREQVFQAAANFIARVSRA